MRRLLIRPGAIGDLIVSLPALERLRAEYTEVWAPEQNLPLIRFANAAQSIASSGLDLLEIDPPARVVERLRSFDSIISWYGSGRVEFRETVARLGLPFRFFPALPIDGKIHAVDFYLQQAEMILPSRATAPLPSWPGMVFPSRARQRAVPPDAHEAFAVIHPFASSPRKRWPMEKFREVARRLTMPVQWCAGPEEELAEAARIENLYELGCWLARARVYIGNDSGISHLASAAGTPTIVLFGPTDPAVWAPRGSRILYPMDSIEPADVIAAVEAI